MQRSSKRCWKDSNWEKGFWMERAKELCNQFQILDNCLLRSIHDDLRESGGDRVWTTSYHRTDGEAAFCGRGSAGPKHCNMHDCDAEEHVTLIHQAPSLVLSTA